MTKFKNDSSEEHKQENLWAHLAKFFTLSDITVTISIIKEKMIKTVVRILKQKNLCLNKRINISNNLNKP